MKPTHHQQRTPLELEYIQFSEGCEQRRAIFRSTHVKQQGPYKPAGSLVSIFISGTVSSPRKTFKKTLRFRLLDSTPFRYLMACLFAERSAETVREDVLHRSAGR